MQYVEQFQKPKLKKQKKAKNNPKPTINDTCYICNAPYAQTHEIYYGKNRQNSIEYGMQCKLCEKHHTGAEGIHKDPYFDFKVKQLYQKQFEEKYSREEFVKVFGRNYLDITYEQYKGVVA